MSVDLSKQKKVLVVHGVQLGSNSDLNQEKVVSELIKNRSGGVPLDYACELYRYEDLNDAAQEKYNELLGRIIDTPIKKIIAQKALDLIGDVVTSYLDTSTAKVIRDGLRAHILNNYNNGNPCYLFTHSLGSIYAFDVINELMSEDQYFDRSAKETWPIQGFITVGSPIGLPMFKEGGFRKDGRREVVDMGTGSNYFRWINYWDRTDPVVSGNIFGQQLKSYSIAEEYQSDSIYQGWVMRDRGVDTGKVWLMSHVSYWENYGGPHCQDSKPTNLS